MKNGSKMDENYMRMKIFISSPQKGLQSERKALIEAIKEKLKLEPLAMELFMSSPERPKTECLKKLGDSDVVILLVGSYYGSIDPESGLSFTEIEYDEATDLGIDVFVFVKVREKEAEWKPEDSTDELKEKHRKFMAKISETRTYKKFWTVEELKSYIIPSLQRYEEERKRKFLPFVDYKEYFSLFLGSDKMFRHDYPLVGREKELKMLKEFIESDKKIAVLCGRGSIGKSKILYEFSKKVETEKLRWRVLFLRKTVIFDSEVVKQIPSGNCIIIVEDAHRCEYLGNVLSVFRNSDLFERVKVIISLRPTDKEIIDMHLSRAIDMDKILRLEELQSLELNETKNIVKNIVGDNKIMVDYLSKMAKDCPLIAIIGSKLVVDKKIDPRSITDNEQFQRIVLDRFKEDLKGQDFSDRISEKLLSYISALSPIRPGDNATREKLSVVLKINISELVKRIDLLEKKGLLLRRGRLVRIVPDVLSDHILYNACVAIDGTSTKFADEVYNEFHGTHLKNLLRNLAEINWRARQSGYSINILNEIWNEITRSFIEAPNYLRIRILGEIEEVGVFQPEQVMDIVKLAIEKPTSKLPKGKFAELLKDWAQEDIIEKLPNILENVAYNLNYVKECCNILWEIGKDVKRELNPHPEHPIRVLQRLASYKYKKPVSYNYKVLEWLEELIKKPNIHNYKYSPLDILDEFLVKEGEYIESEGPKISFSSFPLNYKIIKPIRQRALQILKNCFHSSKPPNAVSRSLKSLIDALRYQFPKFGRIIKEKEEKQWLEEQIQILDIIKEGIKELTSTPVNIEVKKELHWYQLHGRHREIRDKVNEILNSIKEDYEFRLYRAMSYNFMDYHRDDMKKSFDELEKEINKEIRQVADLIKGKEESAKNIFDKLNFVINELEKYKISVNPLQLLAEFTKLYPDLAVEITNMILSNPTESLVKFFSSFLWPLKQIDKYSDKLKNLLRKGMQSKNFWVYINITRAYAWGGLLDEFDKDDIKNLADLLIFEDEQVKKLSLQAISRLGQKNISEAKKLALSIEINNNSELAEELCSIFDAAHGIPPKELNRDDIRNILTKLVSVRLFNIQHYHVDKFLEFVSKKYLDLAVSFLIRRLEHYKLKEATIRDYTPLPYLGFKYAFTGTSQIANYGIYLRKIRNFMLNEKMKDPFWLPKLFEIVSDGYCEKSLQVLGEWLNEDNKMKIEGISLLLRDAPDEFLFKNYDFVGKLLVSAEKISQECLKNVKSDLFSIAATGTRSRSFGEPSQKWINLKDKGKEVADKFGQEHPAYQFYSEVSKYGEEEIQEELQRDEEFLDE